MIPAIGSITLSDIPLMREKTPGLKLAGVFPTSVAMIPTLSRPITVITAFISFFLPIFPALFGPSPNLFSVLYNIV